MDKIKYICADPTGNMTALVKSKASKGDYKEIADMIMEKEPSAEQVGFVSVSEDDNYDIELNMAGGEFCGNATMSAAALFAKNKGSKEETVRVKVSGAKEIIPVKVKISKDFYDSFSCELNMPGAKNISDAKDILGTEGILVELEGITHLVKCINQNDCSDGATCDDIFFNAKEKNCYEEKVKEYCGRLSAQCMGIIFTNLSKMTINALVYVPGADTCFWEKSCASGTVAAGAALLRDVNDKTEKKLTFTHPGGKLSIRRSGEGKYYLSGMVKLVKEGEI